MKGLILKLKQELEIRNFSRQTVKSYVFAVEKFLKFSEEIGLNENSVKNYIQKILEQKNPSTVSQNLSAIEFFFDKVLHQKIKIPHPKRNKPLPTILTIEEVKRLIKATSNIKHNLIIRLLYGCGLRVGEIINLKKQDVNFNESLIHIKMAKGRKDRYVNIPKSLKGELENYCKLNKGEILFPSNRGGKLTTATIRKIIKKRRILKKMFILTH